MLHRPPIARRVRRPCSRKWAGWILAALASLAAVDRPASAGVIADWFVKKVTPTPDKDGGIADTATDTRLMSRWMSKEKNPFTSGAMGQTSVLIGEKGWASTKQADDPQSKGEFALAKKFFDAQDYARADALLRPLAKRELKKGSAWGEKAQFYLAESQFFQKRYTDASDSYEVLYTTYNGTEFLDKLITREYQIAQIWLADDDPKGKPVSFKERVQGRAPVLDAHGYAIKNLEHVRMHDPLGPLADDATIRTADHYHAIGDFETAAVYYDQLVAEYPKSEYRERAQLSTIDAKVKGYIGPEYDSTGLEGARDTIKRTMQEFPEHTAGAEQLYHTQDLINDQAAEREYTTAMYYVKARKPISAEYQFGLVQARWPKSKWAQLSKAELAKIAKAPRKASVPSKIMTQPGANDLNSGGNGPASGSGAGGGMGGMGGMPGMGGAGGGAGGGGAGMGGGSPF